MRHERNIIVVALAIAILGVSCVPQNEVSQKYGYWLDGRKSKVAKFQCINEKFLNIECKEK